MNITIKRDDLLAALNSVSGAIAHNATMPILRHVLLEAEGGSLRVVASNIELELISNAEADIKYPGAICVPGKKLLDIVKTSNAETISLKLVNDRLKVKSGKSNYTLSVLPASDFPELGNKEIVSNELNLTINRETFREMLGKVVLSMAVNDTRYYLNGVCVQVKGGTLALIATDGHRLSVQSCATESKDINAIIPRGSVLEIMKFIKGGSEDIVLRFNDRYFSVQVDESTLNSKFIDGQFPDYRRVIPKVRLNSIILNILEFVSAIERVAVIGDKIGVISVDINKDKLTLKSVNGEAEQSEDEIDIDYSGDDCIIGLTVRYLHDALVKLESDDVEFCFNSLNPTGSQVLIRECDATGDNLTVIMPRRL
jgi:DNA polymerase-3 subunit beta